MALFSTSYTTHPTKTSAISLNPSRQILLSCIIGNALEWYDFVIYGYFAVIFGQLFFSHTDPITQILASWGIFWGGFLARPIGSFVFGHIGDKVSRKYALTLSIMIMAVPTTLIGLLPTYQQIGIIAPFLLFILRTVQGFAIGGEYTGTMIFLVEHAPMGKRGIWGSWASFSAVVGVIVGSCFITGLNFVLPTDAMQSWGWRIPFIVSILGSLVGVYIRMNLSDPEVYLKVKTRKSKEMIPIKDLFCHHKVKMLKIVFLDFLTAVGFFIITIFLATYFRTYLKYTEHVALSIHTVSMAVFMATILIGGWLSDQYGRKSVQGTACIGFILFSYPLFELFQMGNALDLLFAQASLAFMMGLFFGPLPSMLAEIMPTDVRFSGLSIAHNVCMAIVGGGTPFIASYLIHHSDNLSSPAYLLILAATVSLCSLFFIKDRYREPL